MAKLTDLIPYKHNNVIDVVRQAGIDVSSWDYKKDGSVIKNPSVNQSKIYRWSFGGGDEPTLLFIWHDSLSIDDNAVISFSNNLRAYKAVLANIASGSDEGNRNIARLRHERADAFEKAVRELATNQKACKVALLIPHDNSSKEDIDTKSVRFRELDAESWYVHEFDVHNGQFKIIRGVIPDQRIEVDSQFDLVEPPEKYPKSSDGLAYLRSLEIKEKVLRRSQGKCEFCGKAGFTTHKNTLFLEVHHVVPLGKNGVDELWNVVAVCPNHHREAHFGNNRSEMLDQLVGYLSNKYPQSESQLRSLAKQVVW